jgi:hypothetical protein
VGGIIVVVVIATILAIAKVFSGGSPKHNATPPVKVPPAGYCLLPTHVGLAKAELKPFPAKAAIHTAQAKKAIIHAERIISRHSNVPPVISISGRHFVFLNHKSRIVLGTVGGKSHVFKIKAVDVAFNGKGTKIIYQKTSLAHHGCAHLVLMEMKLNGKHKHLMLASGSFDLANSAGTPTYGTLHSDELPSGQILLIHGEHLYAFNAAKRHIGRMENQNLGLLYDPNSSTPDKGRSFVVSPGGRFVLMDRFSRGPVIYKLPTWTLMGKALPNVVLSTVAWSYNGRLLAYPSTGQTDIDIYHVGTGKVTTISWAKKFGHMQISSLAWARDDRHIGFNGVSLLHPDKPPVAMIAPTTGKHLLAHAVSHAKKGKTKVV